MHAARRPVNGLALLDQALGDGVGDLPRIAQLGRYLFIAVQVFDRGVVGDDGQDPIPPLLRLSDRKTLTLGDAWARALMYLYTSSE